MSLYQIYIKLIKSLACTKCHGKGILDDYDGDIPFNTWECPECHGDGLDLSKLNENENALLAYHMGLLNGWIDKKIHLLKDKCNK